MTKLNEVIYQKLVVQAEEAKEQGMEKLAEQVLQAIDSGPEYEVEKYSSFDLSNDVINGLWKLAASVLKYHDLESADIQKLEATLKMMTGQFIEAVEETIDVSGIGPNEEKVMGEE